MANVSERGQIILVVGLVLAVMFVALALLLNTAIYTENLATRSDNSVSGTAGEFNRDAITEVQKSISYANQNNNPSDSDLELSVQSSVDDWEFLAARHYARNGQSVSITVDSISKERHIRQTVSTNNFENRTGIPNWDVTTGADELRTFQMDVRHNVSDVCTTTGTCFTVVFENTTNPSDTWYLYVDNETASTNVKVVVQQQGGPQESCTGDANADINLTEGTLDGTPCTAFSFVDELDGSYDIRFENGAKVLGTYDIRVTSTETDTESITQNYGTVSEPQYDTRIDSVAVSLDFRHADLQFTKTVTVAAEEGV
ncbi:DUF7261 family protein [Haladaptatus sp. CMSO5]|uniref:DUF7261 family protein n=1 Tax=Haladaptatus sp. CMSO5 TaxID=3120514 RepID=UPI002FCDEDE5